MNAPETSFFQSGGALLAASESYVERPSDRELLSALQAGEFCYVLTSRQMGKSSLLVRTTQILRAQGVHVAAKDISGLGRLDVTAEKWYRGLLEDLGTQLRLEDEIEEYWRAQTRLAPVHRFFRALRDVVLKRLRGTVVLFLDEIDFVRSLPFDTDEFFGALKECCTGRAQDAELNRITFCLFGVATPAQLQRDPENPLFNLGRGIELRDFTRTEMACLARGLLSEAQPDTRLASAILDRVHHWTRGQPYLTQKFCRVAAGVMRGESPTEAQELAAPARVEAAAEFVDQLADHLFLSARARTQDSNVFHIHDRLTKAAPQHPALLPLYRRVLAGRRVRDAAGEDMITVLHLAGIVRVEEGRLRVRNRIYETVFDRTWIEQAEGAPRRWSARRRLLAACAGAGLLLVLFLALFWLRRDVTEVVAVLPPEFAGTNEVVREQLDGLFELVSRSLTRMTGEMSPAGRAIEFESPRNLAALNVNSERAARRAVRASYVLQSLLSLNEVGAAELELRLTGPQGRLLGATNVLVPRGDLSRGELPVTVAVVGWLDLGAGPAGTAAHRDPRAVSLRLQALGLMSRRVDRNYVRAAALMEAAVLADPGYAEAWADLAAARLAIFREYRLPGTLASAEQAALRALALDTNSVSAAVAAGQIQIHLGRTNEAHQTAQALHRRRPDDPEAMRLLALSLVHQGRRADAEDLYERALRARPDHWRLHDALAHLRVALGDYPGAEAAFRKVVALTPEDPRSHSNLGGVLFWQGRAEEAEREFNRSLELFETSDALSNLGSIHFFRREYGHAVVRFRQAVAWNPDDHVLQGNFGDALRLAGTDAAAMTNAYRRAVECARRELGFNEANASTRAMLAYYLAALGRCGETAEELGRTDGPGGLEAADLVAGTLAHELCGRRDEALRWLRAALAGGYSEDEIRRHPDLDGLRTDARFIGLSSGTPRP